MKNRSNIINGAKYVDDRGEIRFVNEFETSTFRRCYHITHDRMSVIRAWQGHKKENKAFWVTKGSFLLQWILIDDFKQPNENLKIESSVFNFEEPKVLILPGGIANGFQALEKYSSIMVFSDMSIENSKNDDYRWDKNYFKNAQWK
ncbi:MAG: hypothetical protein ACTIJ9_03690 [Aequorivita sp.]